MTENEDKSWSVNSLIYSGWFCLAMSSLCFYISTRAIGVDSEISYAIWLIVARFFGIGAFIAGGVAIFNQRWMNGTLLFVGSVTLPFVSLFIHGTI